MHDVDIRTRSREDVLGAYKVEYDDQMANWRALDSKAQGAVAVAGLFTGGLLSLVKDLQASEPSSWRLALAVALGLLLVAVLASLRVLWVREVADPPSGTTAAILASDLQDLSEGEATHIARYHGYLGDRAALWERAVADTRSGNHRKAKALAVAQGCLVAAIIVVGGSTLWRLITF